MAAGEGHLSHPLSPLQASEKICHMADASKQCRSKYATKQLTQQERSQLKQVGSIRFQGKQGHWVVNTQAPCLHPEAWHEVSVTTAILMSGVAHEAYNHFQERCIYGFDR